jgi:hypothetical protein
MTITTTRLPPTSCPYCDGLLDAASAFESSAKPKPGNLTVCIYCAKVVVFAEGLGLRRPEPGELEAAYAARPGLEKYLDRAARAVRSLDRRPPFPRA